jgi:Sodium/hydrogen exchanger family
MYWLQGYAFKKRNFFRYFHYIFSFGILGTVIQFVTITLLAYYVSSMKALMIVRDDGVPIGLSLHECMLIASVFSAADEVATLSLIKQSEYPKLSAVLFGEGVMNDAISILLFHAVTNVNPPGAKEVCCTITSMHIYIKHSCKCKHKRVTSDIASKHQQLVLKVVSLFLLYTAAAAVQAYFLKY